MGDNYFLTAPFRGEFFRTRRPVRYERFIPDMQGEERVLNIVLCPVSDGEGRPPKMATLARDVTLRHRARHKSLRPHAGQAGGAHGPLRQPHPPGHH